MKKDNYLIEYESIKRFTIKKFLEVLNSTEGIQLCDLKVKNLTYHNNKPIFPGIGVYLFRDGQRIIYAGKVEKMSFTERIPKHFDLRHYAWFNRMLELVCTKKLELVWNDNNALIASKYAFENFNLVLINFADLKRVKLTEKLLRSSTETLNKFKKLIELNHNKIVDEY